MARVTLVMLYGFATLDLASSVFLALLVVPLPAGLLFCCGAITLAAAAVMRLADQADRAVASMAPREMIPESLVMRVWILQSANIARDYMESGR